MIRVQNWEFALSDFFAEKEHRPFDYGVWDCCLFVCSAIQVITGIDPAESFRGKYGSLHEALTLIKARYGVGTVPTVVEKVTAEHGMKEIPPAFAQRGDIVLLELAEDDFTLGMVHLNGTDVVFPHALLGLRRHPVLSPEAKKAWRV